MSTTVRVCANEFCGHDSTDHSMLWGSCDGVNQDYYGTWACMCRQFERASED